MLVRDAAGPEGREEARLRAQGGVGEQRGGDRGRGRGRRRGVEEEEHLVHADEGEEDVAPLRGDRAVREGHLETEVLLTYATGPVRPRADRRMRMDTEVM